MKNNNNNFEGVFLREEMGFEPDTREIEKNGKKKKKQKDKRNGKNKSADAHEWSMHEKRASERTIPRVFPQIMASCS